MSHLKTVAPAAHCPVLQDCYLWHLSCRSQPDFPFPIYLCLSCSPWPMMLTMTITHYLPYRSYDRVTSRNISQPAGAIYFAYKTFRDHFHRLLCWQMARGGVTQQKADSVIQCHCCLTCLTCACTMILLNKCFLVGWCGLLGQALSNSLCIYVSVCIVFFQIK